VNGSRALIFTVRAEIAGGHASCLPVAIMSGIVDPTVSVPRWLSAAVGLLPVRALAQILQQGYAPVEHALLSDLLVLAGWAAGGCALAVWRFRCD
jgi:hypothetical protein